MGLEYGKGKYIVYVGEVAYKHGALVAAKSFARKMSKESSERFSVIVEENGYEIPVARFERGKPVSF